MRLRTGEALNFEGFRQNTSDRLMTDPDKIPETALNLILADCAKLAPDDTRRKGGTRVI